MLPYELTEKEKLRITHNDIRIYLTSLYKRLKLEAIERQKIELKENENDN